MNAPMTPQSTMPARRVVRFNVNGEPVEALVEPRLHLADYLRESLGLNGTHLGCEHGVCGACTVLLDGEPVRSCITYAVACEGREVRTIEGFPDDAVMQELRAAFTDKHALQCGFCTPGMLIMSRDIVQRMPAADERAIRVELSGNLCRCTGYLGIVNAVMSVCAKAQAGGIAAVTPAAGTGAPRQAAKPVLFEPAMAASAAPAGAATVAAAAESAETTDRRGWTRIEDGFTVAHPPAAVWRVLADLPQATACLPGAELQSHDADSAKGRIKVKFGPMSAAFAGAASYERDDAAMRALIKGAGTDSLSASRARGDIRYALSAAENGRATKVAIELDYSLVGPLAQFSRSGLVKDFASRLIAEFGRNLSARVEAQAGGAAPSSAAAPPPAAEIGAGSMLLSVLWTRLLRLLGLRK